MELELPAPAICQRKEEGSPLPRSSPGTGSRSPSPGSPAAAVEEDTALAVAERPGTSCELNEGEGHETGHGHLETKNRELAAL